jgi:hypothetical protein
MALGQFNPSTEKKNQTSKQVAELCCIWGVLEAATLQEHVPFRSVEGLLQNVLRTPALNFFLMNINYF